MIPCNESTVLTEVLCSTSSTISSKVGDMVRRILCWTYVSRGQTLSTLYRFSVYLTYAHRRRILHGEFLWLETRAGTLDTAIITHNRTYSGTSLRTHKTSDTGYL